MLDSTQRDLNLPDPLEFQANQEFESSVYSKKRLTFSGRFLL